MSTVNTDLYGMDAAQLESYVKDRLARKTRDPGYSADHMEGPENFLVTAYENESASAGYRKRFGEAVRGLLRELDPDQAGGDYMGALFYLVQRLKLQETGPELLKLWEQKDRFRGKTSNYSRPDLLVLLIAAVTRFQSGDEFLEQLVSLIQDRDYAAAAYIGILETGLKNAIQHLPAFAETAFAADKSIWVRRALEIMADRYGEGDPRKGAEAVSKEWRWKKNGVGRVRKRIAEVAEQIPVYGYKLSDLDVISGAGCKSTTSPFWNPRHREAA